MSPGAGDHARLDHVQHVGVAVVVVADVLLVQLFQRSHFVGSPHIIPIPVHHDVLAVRIERRPQQDDDILENGLDLGVVGVGQEVVCQLDRVLCARHF